MALTGAERTAYLQDIVAAADAVLAVVDATAVACHVAAKSPGEGAAAAAASKVMDERKAALIEALEAKAWALLDLHPEANGKGSADGASSSAVGKAGAGEAGDVPPPQVDVFEEVFAELRRWVDTTSAAYALLAAKREARRGRYACAIKVRGRRG